MKKLILACAIAASFATGFAHAAEEKKPDYEVAFNVSVVSDYRYRGISQTRLGPALQGGADLTHNPTGFYAGTWLSTIKWTKDAGGSKNVEWDIYGGKRGAWGPVSYDFGGLAYIYPGNNLGGVAGFVDANTYELYGQLGWGPAYVKYSHSLSDTFGFVNSKDSNYIDVGANIEVGGGYILNLHAGHQKIKNTPAADYTDWKIGVTKDFGFLTGSLAYIDTDASTVAYASPVNGKFMGKDTIVLSISKTF